MKPVGWGCTTRSIPGISSQSGHFQRRASPSKTLITHIPKYKKPCSLSVAFLFPVCLFFPGDGFTPGSCTGGQARGKAALNPVGLPIGLYTCDCDVLTGLPAQVFQQIGQRDDAGHSDAPGLFDFLNR